MVVRARLITNPNGGKGEIDLAPIVPVLAAHGWDVSIRQKLRGGHATELAKEAVDDGCDLVVACGGDGTMCEVVDGVVGADIAVGVLPGGTANLWANEIGVSMDLARAAQQLIGADRRRVDVGQIAINGKNAQHFLLMAGLGLDATVVAGLNKQHKRRFGKLAYVPAIGRALTQATPFNVRVDLDGLHWEGEVSQIVVGNTRKYAAVTSVTPDAIVDDGRLDVALLIPDSAISASQQVVSLLAHNRPAAQTAITDRVGRLTIRSSAIVPVQADGGMVKQKKVELTDQGVEYSFAVKAQALTVLVPRDYSGALFHSSTPANRQDDALISIVAGKRWFRVIAVGVDAITAARVRDGKVFTLLLTPETCVADDQGSELPRATLLSHLAEGDLLQVTGDREPKTTVITASAISVGGN